MGRWWKIILAILGTLWVLFLVAINVTPQEVWEHLVSWWNVIAFGVALVVAVIVAVLTSGIAKTRTHNNSSGEKKTRDSRPSRRG